MITTYTTGSTAETHHHAITPGTWKGGMVYVMTHDIDRLEAGPPIGNLGYVWPCVEGHDLGRVTNYGTPTEVLMCHVCGGIAVDEDGAA